MSGRCPTPSKLRFPTNTAAVGSAAGASRKNERPMRAYRCQCGAWHLASIKPKEGTE